MSENVNQENKTNWICCSESGKRSLKFIGKYEFVRNGLCLSFASASPYTSWITASTSDPNELGIDNGFQKKTYSIHGDQFVNWDDGHDVYLVSRTNDIVSFSYIYWPLCFNFPCFPYSGDFFFILLNGEYCRHSVFCFSDSGFHGLDAKEYLP